MNYFEFYFTKNSIKSIALRESLFDKSAQVEFIKEKTEIRLENPSPILHVTNLEKFDFSKEHGDRYGLVLTDGEEQITCTIDKSLYNFLDANESGRYLQIGSVILLKKYKILSICELLTANEMEIEQDKDKRVLCITDLILLGHYHIDDEACSVAKDNRQHDDDEKHDDVKDHVETNAQITSHLISELEPSLSKLDWSIACKLLDKTTIRQYENKKNGFLGKVGRFLFQDTSGLIELVVFNNFCDLDSIANLKCGKFYTIKNADIKLTKSSLKAWPDKHSVDFEIQVNINTVIKQCDETQCVETTKKNILPKQKTDALNEDKQLVNKTTTTTTQNSSSSSTRGEQKLHEKFTKFNQLIFAKTNSLVDLIGIVCEIGQVKKMNPTSTLSLRNIKLVDEANQPVSVALWGKQAEDFAHNIGTCLMFNKIKVTNYGGLSLSVLRITGIMELKDNYDIPIAKNLIIWWRSSQTNSIQLSTNKRSFGDCKDIDNDDDDNDIDVEARTLDNDSIKKLKI